MTVRLHFRNRLALLYGYLFPLLFLAAFWALYRHEQVPFLLHMGELLTVSVLGGACFGLPTSLVSERERGVWQRYRLTPVALRTLLFSTLLARFFIIASAALLLLGIALLVGMSAPAHPFGLVVAFTAVAFAFIGLGLVIAALADTVPAVQALGQCLFLPMLILGGVAVPIASLPQWAQQLSLFLPGRYAVTALQHAVNADHFTPASFDLLALVLIGTAASVAGARLFRATAGQSFRSVRGKYWLVPAFAAWGLAGLLAASRDHRVAPSTRAADRGPAPAAAVSTPTLPPAPWELLTTEDIASIAVPVPPDEGRVTPIAREGELPDDETDLTLAKLEGTLPHWAPGRVEDPLQRVRNLLSVAGVVDLLQHPVERFAPLLIQQRLETDFPEEKLIRLLAWIALHPEEGTVISDLSDLNLGGLVSEASVRERVQWYAIKLLDRITTRSSSPGR